MHAIFVFETKNIKLINISIKNSLLSWIVKKRIYQIDQFILHPKKTQEDVLSSLIYKSKGTFSGIQHNFNKIQSYSDFSTYVPIRKSEEDELKYNDRVSRWQQLTNDNYNKAEIIIAKQRHGPIGSIKMHFDANYTKFSDLTTKDYDNIIEWLTKVVF